MKPLIEQYLENRAERRAFEQESAILAATEAVHRLMREQGVNQAMLAERLGCSASNVSQILDGENNFTVRTLADILFFLDSRLTVNAEPLSISICSIDWPRVDEIGTEFMPTSASVTFNVPSKPVEPYRGSSPQRVAA